MHRDRDGPSRITTRRSCDTTPSRAVIRTTISVRSPDLGCQGNDIRSPRLASADKYLAIPKYQEFSYKTIPEGSRQAPRDYFMLVEKQLGEMIRLSFHRRDQTCGERSGRGSRNEIFARTIYLENFLLKKLHLIRITSESHVMFYLSSSCPKYCEKLAQIGSRTNVMVSTFE